MKGGVDYFLAPAPTVTIGKSYIRNAGTGIIGSEFSINLKGDILAWKGNPVSSGSDPTVTNSSDVIYADFSQDNDPINTNLASSGYLNAIIKKQERIRELFTDSTSGIQLHILPFNETGSGISAFCSLDSLEFDDQSRWTNRCGWTASLKTNRLINPANSGLFSSHGTEDNFTYYVADAQNEWRFSESNDYTASTGNMSAQQKTYAVNHTVSAIGQRTYTSSGVVSPIVQASGYVHNVIGLGSGGMPVNFLGLPDTYTVYNRTIAETINPITGSYSIDENFVLGPSGQPATETVQITIENDLSPLTKVSIDGKITGFNTQSATGRSVNRYENATTYWNSVSGVLYNRVLTQVPLINSIPLATSVGKNPQEGVISYTFSYDTRPANLVTGSLTEDIQVSDTYPGQTINIVPVIGRSQPIIQYLNSRSEYKRTLQVDITMPFVNGVAQKPSLQEMQTKIYDAYKPIATRVYYGAPSVSWNPKTGQYSYSIEWTFEGPSDQ